MATDVRERIVGFLSEHRPQFRALELADDADLFEARVLDSLGLIELLRFLESSFGIRVSDDDLFTPGLTTIAGLSAFVTGKLDRKSAG